jgi:integrase
VEYRVGKFVDFLGGDIPMSWLDHSHANEWLRSLEGTMAPITLHGYRAALHAVWRFAYTEGMTEKHPDRIRKISRPTNLVEAYTAEDMKKLYRAAKAIPGLMYGNNVPKSVWWPAYIATAYSTGLRRGCLLELLRTHIQTDGTLVVVQQKTKKITTRRLCPEALEGITRIGKIEPKDKRAFPICKSQHEFFTDFRRVRDMAGIDYGTSKWFRRSAISYAEAATPGAGKLIGDHSTEEVTNKSYRDFKIAPKPVVEPPAIDWES